MKRIVTITFAWLLLSQQGLKAQDPHLSLPDLNPQWLNPSLSGEEKGIRTVVQYRNQWSALVSPFRTIFAGVDARLGEIGEDFSYGAGLLMISDEAGDAGFKTHELRINSAFQYKERNERWWLRGGAGFNLNQQGIDQENLIYADQFDEQLEVVRPSNDVMPLEQVNNYAMDFGISSGLTFNSVLKAEAGFSAFRLLSTRKTFFGPDGMPHPMRSSAYLKTWLKLNENWMLQPFAHWMQQYGLSQSIVQCRVNYRNGDQMFFIGGGYRLGRAALFHAGFEKHGFKLAYHHDHQTGSLQRHLGMNATASEITLSYTWQRAIKSVPETPEPDTIVKRFSLEYQLVVLDAQSKRFPDSSVLVQMSVQFDDYRDTTEEHLLSSNPFKPHLLPCRNYTFNLSSGEYLSVSRSFNRVCAPEKDSLHIDTIWMEKISSEKTYRLNNVYYEFDQAEITNEGKDGLYQLWQLLKDNPNIVIELSSHTDSVGSDAYNLELSQKRAENCVQYLASKGIELRRMIAKGYGESQPVAPNSKTDGSDNPEGRALNRRTEFRILGKMQKGVLEYDRNTQGDE